VRIRICNSSRSEGGEDIRMIDDTIIDGDDDEDGDDEDEKDEDDTEDTA